MLITSKGQITIPQEIRNKYGLLPHTAVDVIEKNGAVIIVKVKNKSSRGSQIINNMRGKATVKMTTNQIMALTRDK
jgi:AbrB family looped-hinge helix DNA binding protein